MIADQEITRVVPPFEMEWILAGVRATDDWDETPTSQYVKGSSRPAPADDEDLWPDDEFTSAELSWFR